MYSNDQVRLSWGDVSNNPGHPLDGVERESTKELTNFRGTLFVAPA